MVTETRTESVIIVVQAGRSFRHNAEKWTEWATGLYCTTCDPDGILLELKQHAADNRSTHVWLCDAGYEPQPTAFRKMLAKHVWDESIFSIFKTARPTFARAFYDAKFTADYDKHDKFGGLRYINIHEFLYGDVTESNEWDVNQCGRDIDYVEQAAAKLSFPYSVFQLSSNEPQNVVIAGLSSVQRLYPMCEPHLGEGGILQSHTELAMRSESKMFLVMDADLLLERSLGLETFSPWDEDYVHLWYVKNPINGLIYGHGGPKAFNKESFLQLSKDTVDITTSSNKKQMIVHPECVGVHRFNWSSEATFRTAFRECAKLTWQLNGPTAAESQERLDVWLDEELADEDQDFWEECLDGAKLGNLWASNSEPNQRALINDFEWLHGQYEGYMAMVESRDSLLSEQDDIDGPDDDLEAYDFNREPE
jgi:hypothetical protein